MPFQPAIASMSLGRAWVHGVEHKLNEASAAGFRCIEIFYEDLEYFARDLANLPPNITPSANQLIQAATRIHQLCSHLNIQIIGLQPFLFYEGLLDRAQHTKLIEKLHLWLDIADALGTDGVPTATGLGLADELGYLRTIALWHPELSRAVWSLMGRLDDASR